MRLRRTEGLVLTGSLVGEGWRALELPSGDPSLVQLVEFPVGSAASLKERM
jgi:hypothetical protein